MRFLVPILVAAALVAGCATQLQGAGERRSAEERHFNKNYALGVPRTVTVGEPLVKVQDFWTETVEYPAMVLDRSTTLTGGPVTVTLNAGQKYPVRGRYTSDGTEYLAVASSDNPIQHTAVLVKTDGSLHDRVIATGPGIGGYVQVVYTMNISDPTARFQAEKAQVVKTAKGYENFDILYTGVTANSLNLTYREFSPDGLARVAFSRT